ncbi:MAG: zinc ribbon domain-containing protein [Anaerolineales bacterium]|nr:zinc ribbon domain-containing protein [Anaerolineales bacterium]
MPLYEYQCERCGVRFERYQPMSADPIDACPECTGHVHRVISPVGVIFRGSGFYVTDNRSKSSGSRGKESKPTEASDKGSSEAASTTEAKPSSSNGDETEKRAS